MRDAFNEDLSKWRENERSCKQNLLYKTNAITDGEEKNRYLSRKKSILI